MARPTWSTTTSGKTMLRSRVVALTMMWKMKSPRATVIQHMVKTFTADDIMKAAIALTQAAGLTPPVPRKGGPQNPREDMLAADLFDCMHKLEGGNMPEIVVPCTELSACLEVQGGESNQGLSQLLMTRMTEMERKLTSLQQVERNLENLGEKVEQLTRGPMADSSKVSDNLEQVLNKLVDRLPAPPGPVLPGGGFEAALNRGRSASMERERRGSMSGREELRRKAAAAAALKRQKGEEEAKKQLLWPALAEGGGAAGGAEGGSGHLPLEGGAKRRAAGQLVDEDGFRLQGRRRKVAPTGSSTVDLSSLSTQMTSPIDRYVGNTSLAVSADIVQRALTMCAAAGQADGMLEIIKVEPIGLQRLNARTRAWKVTVPFSCRSIMDKDDTYPPGWTHRAYFAPRGEGQKKPRMGEESHLVNGLLQDEQRAREGVRQAEEDRLRAQRDDDSGLRAQREDEEDRLRAQQEEENGNSSDGDESSTHSGESQEVRGAAGPAVPQPPVLG
jgi:hypothetical protein